MKCKHQTGEFIEVMSATHCRQVENGNVDTIGYNEIGDISHYLFRCYDCKKVFKFGPDTKIFWQRDMYDEFRSSNEKPAMSIFASK